MDFDVTRVNSKQVHVFLTVLGSKFESPAMVARRADVPETTAIGIANGMD